MVYVGIARIGLRPATIDHTQREPTDSTGIVSHNHSAGRRDCRLAYSLDKGRKCEWKRGANSWPWA